MTHFLQLKEALHSPDAMHSFACCPNDELCICFSYSKKLADTLFEWVVPSSQKLDSISIAQDEHKYSQRRTIIDFILL